MTQTTSPKSAQRGQVLKQVGGFELIEKVGQGGMGAVFKARQISLDRDVALKVLPPAIAQNREFIQRFLREARAAGGLNHPHIVQGIDVGLCKKTNLYYFAMEFVDGPPLGRALKQSGAFPEDYVRKIARQIGEALDYAHQNGIVHRDVKPDNILVNSQGKAKLADLGLVKHMQKAEDASLTQAGVAVGTPFYMAPEQVRGQLDKIDVRTDLYSLGATLFHLVTDRTLFSGETNAVIMAAHLSSEAPRANKVNPQVSQGFSRLLAKMLAKDPDDRPLNPKQFLELLERVDEGARTPRRAARGIRGAPGSRDGIRSTTGPRDRIRAKTGPRDRVGSGSGSGIDANGAAKSNAVAYLVAGLAAAVLVIGGMLALILGGGKEPSQVSSNNESTKPVPVPAPAHVPSPAPKVVPPPPAVWDAAGALENARRAVARNPDDLRGIYLLYDRLLAEARREKASDKWIEQFEAARDEAKVKFNEHLAVARAELDAKVKAAREQHSYDAALRAIAKFPKPEDIGERNRLAKLAKDLRREAEGVLDPLFERTRTALKEGRLDDAAASLKKASAVAYRPSADVVAGLQSQLDKARGNAVRRAEDQARAVADAAWSKLLDEFDAAVLEKNDLEMMRVILKTAREDKKLDPRREDVSQLNQVGSKLAGFADRRRNALDAAKGQKVDWMVDGKRINGRIKSVKDGVIDLMVTMDKVEMVHKVNLAKLSAKDRAKLVPPLEPKGSVEALAAGILNLTASGKDPAAAKQFLGTAGDGALAKRYLEITSGISVASAASDPEAEAAAVKAWDFIELTVKRFGKAKLSKLQMDKVSKNIAAFKKAHGDTQFAADNQEKIAALLTTMTPVNTGTVTASRLVLWNLHGYGSLYSVYGGGTTRADVVLYKEGKPLWQARNIRVIYKLGSSASTTLALPKKVEFDKMKVFVTNWTGAEGGFTEIQVFNGEENIAVGRATKVSDYTDEGPGSKAVDGVRRSSGYSAKGWILPERTKGWIEIDFSKPASGRAAEEDGR